jgi:KDO2-lipid IV(A) lauroyltransferase
MIRLVRPDWKAEEITKSMYNHIWHLPLSLIEYGKWDDESCKKQLLGFDEFLEEMASLPEDRGVVFVAAHLGPWELCAQTIARYYRPVISLYKPAKQEWINRFFRSARHRFNQTTLPKEGGMLGLYKHLRRGGAAGLVVDQHAHQDHVESTFLGKPCGSWDSAAQLAIRAKCSLIPVGILHEGHQLRFLHGPDLLKEQANADPHTLTREIDKALSGMVERAPEQWLWLGRRWGRNFQKRMTEGFSEASTSP